MTMPFNSKIPQHLLPIALLIILALAFFYPVILGGKTFYAFDVLQQHPPWLSKQVPNNSLISDPVNLVYSGHVHFQQAIKEGVLR